jgi:hypothetical protein
MGRSFFLFYPARSQISGGKNRRHPDATRTWDNDRAHLFNLDTDIGEPPTSASATRSAYVS